MNDEFIELVVRENLAMSPLEAEAVAVAQELGLPPEAVDYEMENIDE